MIIPNFCPAYLTPIKKALVLALNLPSSATALRDNAQIDTYGNVPNGGVTCGTGITAHAIISGQLVGPSQIINARVTVSSPLNGGLIEMYIKNTSSQSTDSPLFCSFWNAEQSTNRKFLYDGSLWYDGIGNVVGGATGTTVTGVGVGNFLEFGFIGVNNVNAGYTVTVKDKATNNTLSTFTVSQTG